MTRGGRDHAQEIRATLSISPVNEIRRDDAVAVGLKLSANGAVAAGRLPDRPVELFDAKQGTARPRVGSGNSHDPRGSRFPSRCS